MSILHSLFRKITYIYRILQNLLDKQIFVCYTYKCKLSERRLMGMKSLGIVRKVDELGRIVLPKELRTKFDIAERDALEIYTEGDNKIVLKKYEPACTFCGDASSIFTFKGRNVCPSCAKELRNIDVD